MIKRSYNIVEVPIRGNSSEMIKAIIYPPEPKNVRNLCDI